MSGEPTIVVQDVTKKYRLFASKRDRMREALDPFRRTYHREFWALKNVSFTVSRGQTVGILGMNGSGKSTLLQIIASVLQPTSGLVRVNGKVAALLELGAGFNPDLTGRENVMLNGTIMGLSREQILAKLPEIEAFADVGEFFEQPMKTYSSGMFMRVAFSTALYVDPEVLIIDEALSVGDAKFQEKCFRRFRSFQEAGKTILFVTHDRSAVPRHCNLGMLLHRGELIKTGDPAEVADMYGELLTVGQLPISRSRCFADGSGTPPGTDDEEKSAAAASELVRAFMDAPPTEDRCPRNPTYNPYERRFGNKTAEIVDYMIVDRGAVNPGSIRSDTTIDIFFKVVYRQKIEAPIVGAVFSSKEGVLVYGVQTDWLSRRPLPAKAGDVRVYRLSVKMTLAAGDWFLQLAAAESTADICDCRTSMAHLFVTDRRQYIGLANLQTEFEELDLLPTTAIG